MYPKVTAVSASKLSGKIQKIAPAVVDDIVKSHRRLFRGQRKVKSVKTKKQEGKVYGAGMAS